MMKTHAHNRIDESGLLNSDDGSPAQRRGMAIMLVLISVAAATVMTAAYVTSRHTAPQVSQNIASGSSARSSAEAGLRMANALLQCEDADFRAGLVNGALFDLPVGNGRVKVTVTDLDGTPVARSTQYVKVKATGVFNGMEQVAEATALVASDQSNPSPTFSDFAIFGSSLIEVTDGLITSWTQSPQAVWGAPIWLGTNSILSSSVALSGATHVVDADLHVDHDGGSAVLFDTSIDGNSVHKKSLAGNLTLPVLDPPTPDVSMCLVSETPTPNITNTTVVSNRSWILNSVRIANTGKVRVNSPTLVTRHVLGSVIIENGGVLIVETDHDFIIDGDLIIRNGSGINVKDGVKCRIWVGGSIIVDYGALGVSLARASTVTDPTRGLELYKNPGECELYQLPGSIHNTWVFDNGSVIVARTYAPNADVSVSNGSSYMGSIMAMEARVLTGSALHYDPTLDARGGYTNTKGPLYNSDTTLNTTLLASVTDISNSSLAVLSGIVDSGRTVAIVPPGNPSPRNRKVKWKMKRLGIKTVKDKKDKAIMNDGDSGVLPAG